MRKSYQGDDYQVRRISCHCEVLAVGIYTSTYLTECQVHASRPFQGANMLYVYMPLEEALQNEAVGMNYSEESQYQF